MRQRTVQPHCKLTDWLVALLVVSSAATGVAQTPAPDGNDSSAIRGERFHGRGVYYFTGSVRCPLAGIGARADNASNRLALDDGFSTVRIDRATHRILFTNTHAYARRQIVGDLLFLGIGTTSAGDHTPFGVHLKIEKNGNRFSTQVHPHPTTREKVGSAEYEPFEVVLSNGVSDTVALTGEGILKAIREPELTARLASIFVQVTDNLDGVTPVPAQPNSRLVDLAIGFGIEHLNLKVARIELISLNPANAPLIEGGALAEMFRTGSWEFQITSLTPFLPREEFSRDFFLLGLDHIAVLKPAIDHGLKQGERLVVGYRDGKGFIGIGSATAEIPDPIDVARAYMEFNFVGGLLARQISQLPTKLK